MDITDVSTTMAQMCKTKLVRNLGTILISAYIFQPDGR